MLIKAHPKKQKNVIYFYKNLKFVWKTKADTFSNLNYRSEFLHQHRLNVNSILVIRLFWEKMCQIGIKN